MSSLVVGLTSGVLLMIISVSSVSSESLTDLYNSNVVHAEYVTRPLSSSYDKGKYIPGAHHAGVRVTTENGGQWLVHKGPNFGKSSDTVVTSASHMSERWMTTKQKDIHGSTVGDFVKQGLPDKDYSVWSSNCQHAAKSMWKKND